MLLTYLASILVRFLLELFPIGGVSRSRGNEIAIELIICPDSPRRGGLDFFRI